MRAQLKDGENITSINNFIAKSHRVNASEGLNQTHPASHFGRYGKGHCLLNDPRAVGLLQLSPVRHVGCESEQDSTRPELRRANHNKDQTF